MSFILGKDGDISLFRVGTLVAIVGVVLVAGGIAAFLLDQNSYRVPLDVDPYPGAESWGNVRESGATRRLVFLVSDVSPEEVAAYYDQKLLAFDGGEQGCERIPAVGEVEGAATDRTVVPYWYKCLFQRTGLRSSQQTTVTVQPGVFNADPAMNTEGKTVVEHSQRWQP